MDFAKKQLEKYGWKEGQGLGKQEDGISTAIKPKLKFDNAGLGHNVGKEFTDSWWNNIYQSALSNVEVKNETRNVKITVKDEEPFDISTKAYIKGLKKHNVSLEYGSFLKTSKLTQNGTVNYNVPSFSEANDQPKVHFLSDEELLAACGGRTAHKGARHGLKLTGKLSRLEKQEKMLLKKLQNITLYDEKNGIERKMKKIAKHREKHRIKDEAFGILNYEDDSRSSSSSTSKKHKKKKKRKSVSFNETVTEYHTQDLDSSVHSSDSNETSVVLTIIGKSQIKDDETPNNNDIAVFDEGIEQDLETVTPEECNHKSFEEAQDTKTERLSKAERNLKKKNRATIRFLQEMNKSNDSETSSEMSASECKKCTKRKQDEEYSAVVWSPKRYCEYEGLPWSVTQKKKNKKNKKKMKEKMRKRKRVEKRIDSITKSLDKVCIITDNK